jgi:hypothetical protein
MGKGDFLLLQWEINFQQQNFFAQKDVDQRT